MATQLHSKLHSLKLAIEKQLMKKFKKKVAILLPSVHKYALIESSSVLAESPYLLEKTSSFSSVNIRDDTNSSCYESACARDTTEYCLTGISPHLKIPQEMKSDPHYQYINEIHYYLKMMESNVVFPVESGVLSKQSLMTNHHYSIVTDWMAGVQQEMELVNDTLHIAVNLMNQYFKVCIKICHRISR